MRKEYQKPDMTLTCYNSQDNVSNLVNGSSPISLNSRGNQSRLSYQVTQLN